MTAGEAVTAAVEVRDLTVRYRDVVALDRAELTLAPGVVCGLIGMNGSGKSTLMTAVVGLVRPDSGTVRVLGRHPDEARREGLVAYVPQSEAVDHAFPLSVREVVMTGRYGRMGLTRRPSRADQDAVDAALARVDLTALADRQIGSLSGGQRKRAFVARGLAQGARVLLLDEPFAGVDRPSQDTITEVLRDRAAEGCAVLVSTHDLHGLPDLCTQVVLLLRRVLAHGPTAQVLTPESLALTFGLGVPAGGADQGA